MPSSISNPKDTFSNSGVYMQRESSWIAGILVHHRLPSRQQVCTTSFYISSKKKHLLSNTRSKRNAGRPRGRNWLTLLSLLVIFFILSDGVALHLFFLFFLLFFLLFSLSHFFPVCPLYFFLMMLWIEPETVGTLDWLPHAEPGGLPCRWPNLVGGRVLGETDYLACGHCCDDQVK
ncbi:hypothetical protein M438DRAFT_215722 [Aureobasidium pullulans EXF-150]|uniref:Uncharacterized protein n=1 Tax=Aureobasidium pullulans EXF-150 TaxID=1043002 RepID=A0A074XG97_AURPU|nr:uncharacterized protein M438DRAFT_215722 [Aureobasidium pullulans EXF-150]KEQ84540.1 hypothetical protein M438DRAFT_215722 [Aureobasidium pullulans EXF-150]